METKTEKQKDLQKIAQASTLLVCGILAGIPAKLLCLQAQGIISNTSYSVKPRKVCK